jgi:hypothetical protein
LFELLDLLIEDLEHFELDGCDLAEGLNETWWLLFRFRAESKNIVVFQMWEISAVHLAVFLFKGIHDERLQ